MKFSEQPLVFRCGGDELLGIVALPEQAATTAVVIVVGGPQYRVGSHRQFRLLAAALATAGYPVLRFDYRGMGDSSGERRDFTQVNEDIGAAIDALCAACPQTRRVVLWGLCDAASASLLYLDASGDPRVGGLVLLNPWVRSPATQALTRVKHYYGQRLLQAAFWRKLLSGQLAVGKALAGFLGNLRRARRRAGAAEGEGADAGAAHSFQQGMRRGLRNFPGETLLLLSGKDYTAREFVEMTSADAEWSALLARAGVTRVELADADHTFSSARWRGEVEAHSRDWLASLERLPAAAR
ncbi:hydrolase 1, exosortase A system-associated [Rhodocyclus purpureus]|uniref:hydrolase 1, exosortase A system-associated n=1 Tax=Rhodocyclus purpureus TaxID=1067 RepID=UPI001911F9E9|nr:hydrolase 1, exosortase A system-associated [Rhodocyclus purpureus]MBK5912973.1 hydrolase 1, exosortase A system-associated [Rhodocyclus purpureus]